MKESGPYVKATVLFLYLSATQALYGILTPTIVYMLFWKVHLLRVAVSQVRHLNFVFYSTKPELIFNLDMLLTVAH